MKKISPQELFEKMEKNEKLFLLDVRAEEKFQEFHIESISAKTHNIPKKVIFNEDENSAEIESVLPKDSEIIVTCTTGNSATKCANVLAEKNYDVVVLDGGITSWKEYLSSKN